MHEEIKRIIAGGSPWRQYLTGTGRLETEHGALRLLTVDAQATGYSDAQLDDYQPQTKNKLLRRPPLRVSLRARFSHEVGTLRGTAGFGLWNYPSAWPPALPRAIWFFYASPPSNMALAQGVAGQGWKAATIDAARPRALALLPFAPIAVPLMWLPPGRALLWPPIQRAVGVAEAAVAAAMDTWHQYEIVWGPQWSQLSVDGVPVLERAPSPRGPLCFVAWLDNQYLVVTPGGRLAWGLLDAPGEQWLEIADLVIRDEL